MDAFWRAVAFALVATVLSLAVGKQEQGISTMLTMAVCCIIGSLLLTYINPVLETIRQWGTIAKFQDGVLSILLKAVGIGLIAELAGMVCCDAGNTTLGKMLQMLASTVILYLTIPVLQSLLSMIQEILQRI